MIQQAVPWRRATCSVQSHEQQFQIATTMTNKCMGAPWSFLVQQQQMDLNLDLANGLLALLGSGVFAVATCNAGEIFEIFGWQAKKLVQNLLWH